MLRVLNCTPGKEVRALRHELLKAHNCHVVSPPTEYEAAEYIRTRRVDVLLLCFRVEQGAADRLCSEFRAHCPGGKIVAVVDELPRTACTPDVTVGALEPAAMVREVLSSDVPA